MNYTQVYPLQISQSMSLSGGYVLVLHAPECNKQIPIIIGEAEAQAIVMAIEQKKARRPLTHHLLNNIMEEYMLVLKQVTIDRFEEGIFYSTLYIRGAGRNLDGAGRARGQPAPKRRRQRGKRRPAGAAGRAAARLRTTGRLRTGGRDNGEDKPHKGQRRTAIASPRSPRKKNSI